MDPGLLTNYVTDEEKARELIKRKLSGLGSYIIDTVAINLIDGSLIDWCIVLRLNPMELMRRLLMRNWPRCKVVENVLAEVVGSSLSMAIDLFGKDKIIEVDTTGKGIKDIIKYIINHVLSGNNVVGVVDWLDVLDTDFLVGLSREMDECLT
ncbi:kinase [Vulcanisaeta sp. JCM 16161]|uniref:kinase n=1 Tax=Vulcanisaeta sp. JCM 16161 TaxID=1295372 RepID=UPI000B06F631|nr:kinase [Vulcanisaeta sp. JCM 16161]